MHIKGIITLEQQLLQKTEKKKFKICALFTNCIDEINNTKVDDAHYVDVVMSMYNLVEYGNTYSKKNRSFMVVL